MNINLQKLNNFSELKEKSLVAITNVENAKDAIMAGDLISILTYEVSTVTEEEAVLKALNNNNLSSNIDVLIISETSFKALNIHKVDFTKEVKEAQDTNKEVIALKRKLRKADKKSRAFKAILNKHDIATNQESQELREFTKKIQKLRQRAFAVSMVDQFTENIVGFNANIIVGTNYVNEVEVVISVDRESNPYNKLPRDIAVVGTAKVHPEDEFNYSTGVNLALMRAKVKLMEQILK